MKITIVMGFFLPVPPAAGGAAEKTWHRLAVEFARRGHTVTLVSRRWRDWPANETVDGVRFLRLPGFAHRLMLWKNLLHDFIWGIRVGRHLPEADVVVLNTISLACWLGLVRPKVGRIIVMLGRMPKGQFRFYQRLARILVPSSPVLDAVAQEKPAFTPLLRNIGCPIDWTGLARPGSHPVTPVTIGYIGRIHREKGLHLLLTALCKIGSAGLPEWRAIICGPTDVAHGGSGSEYLQSLRASAPAQVSFLDPIFDEPKLQALYRQFDLFCYPSLAGQGETFGVAVAEAMAAGAVPIVSGLACFQDFVIAGVSGLIFDADALDAADQLAGHLTTLLRDEGYRQQLGIAARNSVQRYDYPVIVDGLLADFAQLTATTMPSSSDP